MNVLSLLKKPTVNVDDMTTYIAKLTGLDRATIDLVLLAEEKYLESIGIAKKG